MALKYTESYSDISLVSSKDDTKYPVHKIIISRYPLFKGIIDTWPETKEIKVECRGVILTYLVSIIYDDGKITDGIVYTNFDVFDIFMNTFKYLDYISDELIYKIQTILYHNREKLESFYDDIITVIKILSTKTPSYRYKLFKTVKEGPIELYKQLSVKEISAIVDYCDCYFTFEELRKTHPRPSFKNVKPKLINNTSAVYTVGNISKIYGEKCLSIIKLYETVKDHSVIRCTHDEIQLCRYIKGQVYVKTTYSYFYYNSASLPLKCGDDLILVEEFSTLPITPNEYRVKIGNIINELNKSQFRVELPMKSYFPFSRMFLILIPDIIFPLPIIPNPYGIEDIELEEYSDTHCDIEVFDASEIQGKIMA